MGDNNATMGHHILPRYLLGKVLECVESCLRVARWRGGEDVLDALLLAAVSELTGSVEEEANERREAGAETPTVAGKLLSRSFLLCVSTPRREYLGALYSS